MVRPFADFSSKLAATVAANSAKHTLQEGIFRTSFYQDFGALSLSGASGDQTENIPFGLPSRVPAGNTYTASSKWAKPAKTVESKTTTPVAVPPRRGYASDTEDEMWPGIWFAFLPTFCG
ncbi:hypothetical protein L207DRAFT_592937 [Hyaloscypha variabilis F]|uniref:Uncharacterized protein n=1 Tax=Hyaloscypha variabilis (strain UAMH 11265 / GT02V1 / F) TaxID=1149755 RepID=A0A2J6QUE9_HYAVF|nr:hypothetical protein L207DRAFT_592937 [Hyaloscypha variabilis F]